MNPGTQMTIDRLAGIPRKVRLQRKILWLRVGIWAAAFFTFVIVPLLGWQTLSRIQTLQEKGVVVQARVVGKHYGRSRGAASTMTVAFTYAGKQITAKRDFGWAAANYWNSPTVPVTIMPDHPEDWELGILSDEAIGHEMNAWYGIGGLWACIVLFFLFGFEFSFASERALLSKGRVVPGTMLSLKRLGKGRSKATYTIPTMHGAAERSSLIGSDIAAQYPPGAEIVVFCLGEDSQKTMPLGCFSCVELAND